MFLRYHFKYFMNRYEIIISLPFLICISLLFNSLYVEKITYVNDVINFYESRENDALGITSIFSSVDDMFYYYDENRVLFFWNITDSNQETNNGFTGIVIQQIDQTKYTNVSYYSDESIIDGEFTSLESNEIAISKDIADKYHINVGEKAYVMVNRQPFEVIISSILKPTNHIIRTNPERQVGLIIVNAFLDLKSTYEYQYIHFFNEDSMLQSYSTDIVMISESLSVLNEHKQQIMFDFSILLVLIIFPIALIIHRLIIKICDTYVYVASRYKINLVFFFDLFIYFMIFMIANYILGQTLNIYHADLFRMTGLLVVFIYLVVLTFNFIMQKIKEV
jgi:hypothetical protein